MIETPETIKKHLKDTHVKDLEALKALVNEAIRTAASAGKTLATIDTSHVRDEVVADLLTKLKEAGWKPEFNSAGHQLRIHL